MEKAGRSLSVSSDDVFQDSNGVEHKVILSITVFLFYKKARDSHSHLSIPHHSGENGRDAEQSEWKRENQNGEFPEVRKMS